MNRRVIVNEAYQRAEKIAKLLLKAETHPSKTPVLARVGSALRTVSTLRPERAPPLDVLELRGGIYRDNRWARSATQPTVICSTIDQLGSRLLFRGYGVSANAAPIHAALIAYDSLVLLDEAHISRPFLQTLESVQRYLDPQKWAEQAVGVQPMRFVPMTATPPDGLSESDVIRLEDKDRENDGLKNRLTASKPAKLTEVKNVAEAAVSEATALAKDSPRAVGIIVNRVKTAKAIYEQLQGKYPNDIVELVIGSMRPVDRDLQAKRLQELVGPNRPAVTERRSFIVATQCLEVGADYDFDVLVTECASLDALRQRFGRLNRGGRRGADGQAISSQATIMIDEKQRKEEAKLDPGKPLDPIYGNALALTWNWLSSIAKIVQPPTEESGAKRKGKKQAAVETRIIDFGIDNFKPHLETLTSAERTTLSAPSASKDAPVMFPTYVDFWCQTNPAPTPDPDVSLFIHGPQSGEPDVQVCWRADLIEDDKVTREDWCDIIGLLPPTSAECMTVPISRLKRWLAKQSDNPDESDLLGVATSTDAEEASSRDRGKTSASVCPDREGLVWRGTQPGKSKIGKLLTDISPQCTLVLPVSAGGWEELGHIPPAAAEKIDMAELAFQAAKDRAVLRLHPALKNRLPECEAFNGLLTQIADPEAEPISVATLRQQLRYAAEILDGEFPEFVETCRRLTNPKFGLMSEYYPDGRGFVLTTRRRIKATTLWSLPDTDEGDDEKSHTMRENPVSLIDHTQHVCEELLRTISALPVQELKQTFELAATWHDLGKADERFQAMLRRADCTDAWLYFGSESMYLAKSDGAPTTRQQRKQARERAGLPQDFRHEMLSMQIVENTALAYTISNHRSLLLHVIAAHHGYARPFAPIVLDKEPPDVCVHDVTISQELRLWRPAHRIDSGIAERFWECTRQYGWWGLAYLESLLRLADQQASADEDLGIFEANESVVLTEATV